MRLRSIRVILGMSAVEGNSQSFRAEIGALGASAPKSYWRCCSMYCLTISNGAPPQDAAK